MWSDADHAVISGDLAVAVAYTTPAGGCVVTAVSPVGLCDREAGTVGFTTSLGFGRKLERLKADPKVALAYHAREHGFADDPRYVHVQGIATYETHPDKEFLDTVLAPAAERFLGPPKRGWFWDRWLSAYYADRVPVTVKVQRVISPDPPAPDDVPPQQPPKNGTAARVDVRRALTRIRALPHVLLAYRGADGFPVIVPVTVGDPTPAGIPLSGPLPAGGRRAGLLAHSYRPKLIGLESRQHTGWLQDGVYAPHTESGFKAPSNKTLLLLGNGYLARRGLQKARAAGRDAL
jgi:hypothetical protein